MNQNQFNILAIVTALLLVSALAMSGPQLTVKLDFNRGQELVPGFNPEDITTVRIQKGKEAEVVLRGQGESFVVESRNNYPADTGKINKLINDCLGIKCAMEVSESKEAHGELGLTPGHEDATVVRFMNGEKDIVGVVIGKSAEGSGNYVRVFSDDQSFTSTEAVYLDTAALDYVDKVICEVPNTDLEKVECSGEGQPYVIAAGKDSSPKLEGIPEGMVAKGDHNQVFGAVNSLRFADFKSESDLKDLDFKYRYAAVTRHGARYNFQLAKKDDKYYAKVRRAYVGPPVGELRAMLAKDIKDEKEQEKKAKLVASFEAVEPFNQQHQSWVYELESWTAGNMTKAFKDLIDEDKKFLNVEEKDISTVSVSAGEKPYSIASPEEGRVELQGIPADKQNKGFGYQQVFTGPLSLAWSERMKPEDEALKGLEFKSSYRMQLRNGLRYEFQIAKKDDSDSFLKVKAVAPDGDTDDATIAKAAALKFNKRHEGHTYKVPTSSVAIMQKPFADLVMDAAARPEEIGASHILISYKGAERSTQERSKEEAKTKAEEVLKKVLAEPAKFAELAKENSDGPSKDKGGSLGTFGFGAMTKAFSEAAFKLKPGEVTQQLVETEFGFHIIKRDK